MEHWTLLWAAIKTPPPRLFSRSRRKITKSGKQHCSSVLETDEFSQVSVKTTRLQSVVSIMCESESRFGKILLMFVYTKDRAERENSR